MPPRSAIDRSRALTLTGITACLALSPGLAAAGSYNASASCDASGVVSVSWTYYEDPVYPSGHPEWVGYDVLRHSLDHCEPDARVNATTFARTPGLTQSYVYTETAAASGITYEYRVIMVDASHNQLFLGFPECDLCSSQAFASCPQYSGPITQGALQNIGGMLFVQPCATGCFQSFYLSAPWPPELNEYVGTGTAIRFYGTATCGTVEGCALAVSRYDVAGCDATPARHPTWRALTAIYR